MCNTEFVALIQTNWRLIDERDEARAVARRLYAENKLINAYRAENARLHQERRDAMHRVNELASDNARLQQENKAYVREYHFAFENWQEYAQRCQDYYSENARLRTRLQELEGEQEPGP